MFGAIVHDHTLEKKTNRETQELESGLVGLCHCACLCRVVHHVDELEEDEDVTREANRVAQADNNDPVRLLSLRKVHKLLSTKFGRGVLR